LFPFSDCFSSNCFTGRRVLDFQFALRISFFPLSFRFLCYTSDCLLVYLIVLIENRAKSAVRLAFRGLPLFRFDSLPFLSACLPFSKTSGTCFALSLLFSTAFSLLIFSLLRSRVPPFGTFICYFPVSYYCGRPHFPISLQKPLFYHRDIEKHELSWGQPAPPLLNFFPIVFHTAFSGSAAPPLTGLPLCSKSPAPSSGELLGLVP